VEDFAADMVIDLSSVTIADLKEDVSEGVLVDALDEEDAQLRIEGSDETRNVLLGGAKSDYLVGGNGDDILYGGNALDEDESVADILEGGDGADLYVIEGGDFETMDTIVGLDLNGEDQISFGRIIKKEELGDCDEDKCDLAERADFLKELGAEFVLVGGLTVEHIVNGGAVKVLDGGPSLAEALQAMFQGGGLFTGSTGKNAAGLFQYGEDHYL